MPDLSKYLEQTDNDLMTFLPCKLTLDASNYELDKNIQIFEDHVWVSSLISKIEYEDLMFNLILDYPVDIPVQKEMDLKEGIEVEFEKNSILLTVSSGSLAFKKQSQFLERLLGGREIYKDVNHLLQKIYSLFNSSGLDLVHLEVLTSQCLRDRSNLSIPARLGKTWDPTMVNIKEVVFQSGFIQGLSFENVNKSLETGLIYGEDLEPSILERVLTGTLIEEKNK